MNPPSKIEQYQIEHWQEVRQLAAERYLAAELKLGELSLKFSGQLALFDSGDYKK